MPIVLNMAYATMIIEKIPIPNQTSTKKPHKQRISMGVLQFCILTLRYVTLHVLSAYFNSAFLVIILDISTKTNRPVGYT
jgi:hypothetical protein